MLNWMNPQWQAQHPGNPWASLFGGGTPAYAGGGGWDPFATPAVAAPGLEKNVAAQTPLPPAGATQLTGDMVPRGTDQKVNPNAVMAINPQRQQLAQIMTQLQPLFGQGPAWGSGGGNGPNYGGREGRAGSRGWGGGSMASGGWGRGTGGVGGVSSGGLY